MLISLKKKAFSLLELVFLLFLAAVILLAVSQLTDRTYKVMKQIQEKAKTYESAALACTRLSAEIRESVLPLGLTASKVTITKINPTVDTGRGMIPTVPAKPSTHPAPTGPYPAGNRLKVEYEFRAGTADIIRTVGGVASTAAESVEAFSVTPHGSSNSYYIKLSLQEKRRIVVLQTYVSCPGLVAP